MDDDGCEDYVYYGTALEAASEAPARRPKDANEVKALPVWQQEATDEAGRRRFHGAFTGGFSAGFFNTVGSKVRRGTGHDSSAFQRPAISSSPCAFCGRTRTPSDCSIT